MENPANFNDVIQEIDPELLREIENTKQSLKLAEQHLNNAEGDFIEVAIYEIEAYRRKLRALFRKARGECA